MYLIFDTETTGLPLFKQPVSNPGQPRIVQIAALLLDEDCIEVAHFSTLIRPSEQDLNHFGWHIQPGAQAAHGITEEMCKKYGVPITAALEMFYGFYTQSKVRVAHNLMFDSLLIDIECQRRNRFDFGFSWEKEEQNFCTMLSSTDMCKLPKKNGSGGYKWPKLEEALKILCGKELVNAHEALADCRGCAEIFKVLRAPRAIAV